MAELGTAHVQLSVDIYITHIFCALPASPGFPEPDMGNGELGVWKMVNNRCIRCEMIS